MLFFSGMQFFLAKSTDTLTSSSTAKTYVLIGSADSFQRTCNFSSR